MGRGVGRTIRDTDKTFNTPDIRGSLVQQYIKEFQAAQVLASMLARYWERTFAINPIDYMTRGRNARLHARSVVQYRTAAVSLLFTSTLYCCTAAVLRN